MYREWQRIKKRLKNETNRNLTSDFYNISRPTPSRSSIAIRWHFVKKKNMDNIERMALIYRV